VSAGNLGDQVHVTAPLCAFLGVSVRLSPTLSCVSWRQGGISRSQVYGWMWAWWGPSPKGNGPFPIHHAAITRHSDCHPLGTRTAVLMLGGRATRAVAASHFAATPARVQLLDLGKYLKRLADQRRGFFVRPSHTRPKATACSSCAPSDAVHSTSAAKRRIAVRRFTRERERVLSGGPSIWP
jgi:hypothetical protein